MGRRERRTFLSREAGAAAPHPHSRLRGSEAHLSRSALIGMGALSWTISAIKEKTLTHPVEDVVPSMKFPC